MTAYRTVDVDGVEVFYREAGDPGAPTLLLLHGFPTSSTQYQELIDRLSDRFHLVAPDYPGFGYTEPLEGTTTFERLADVVDGFVQAVNLDHYGLYLFDFGARLVRHCYRSLTVSWICFGESCGARLVCCLGIRHAIRDACGTYLVFGSLTTCS